MKWRFDSLKLGTERPRGQLFGDGGGDTREPDDGRYPEPEAEPAASSICAASSSVGVWYMSEDCAGLAMRTTAMVTARTAAIARMILLDEKEGVRALEETCMGSMASGDQRTR